MRSSAFSRSVSFPTANPVFSTVLLLLLLLLVSQCPDLVLLRNSDPARRSGGSVLVHSFVWWVPPRTPPCPNRQHHTTIPCVAGSLSPTCSGSRWCSAVSAKKSSSTSSSSSKKKQPGKKKAAVFVSSGLRGFGTAAVLTTNNKKSNHITLDTSPETRAFYQEFLSSSSSSSSSSSWDASDNLKRTALGFTTLKDDTPSSSSPQPQQLLLRGVIATRDIAKGSPILDLPYECAMDLGPEGVDPTVPALTLLQDYCATLHQPNAAAAAAPTLRNQRYYYYYRMLPPYQGEDCRTCTDFFTDDALEALQSPLIVEETQRRRQRTADQFATTFATATTSPELQWIDGTPLTVDHLQWAVWLITSRVLTVQGGATSSSKLLIPYLDMCNHDRQSPHILTGRAVPGGRLRVVAGANVAAGTPIAIGYSGGTVGNDRFLQDYGFLDPDERAYDFVAQSLAGNSTPFQSSRSTTSSGSRPRMSEADRQRSLEALRTTTMREDEAALAGAQDMDVQIRTAIQYRLGVKRALSKYMRFREVDGTLRNVQ